MGYKLVSDELQDCALVRKHACGVMGYKLVSDELQDCALIRCTLVA